MVGQQVRADDPGINPLVPFNPATQAVPLLDTSGTNGPQFPLIANISLIVFSFLTLIAGILAVFFLIFYGIQYITAGGSADKAKAARQGIINAIIGIIIVVASFAIIRFASSIGYSLGNAL